MPLKGEYTFRLEGTGHAALSINGESVLTADGQLSEATAVRVSLHKGYNRVEIRYEAPADGDATLRLMWSSPDFPDEPVPPTMIWSDRRDAALAAGAELRRGRELYAVHQCGNCHFAPQPVGAAAIAGTARRGAPDLTNIGRRLNSEWIRAWLLDPEHVRNDTLMPALFDKSDAASRQEVADLAAWLSTNGAAPVTTSPTTGEELIEAGAKLFADLGCIACHRMTPPDGGDDYERVSLHFIAVKFRPGALKTYLRQPHAHAPRSRMPDFRLSEAEAKSIAAYLNAASEGRFERSDDVSSGDPQRGRKLFQSRGCANCHLEGDPPLAAGLPVEPVARAAAGCLSGDATSQPRRSPHYKLSAGDRQALIAFLDFEWAEHDISPEVNLESAQALVRHLRCGACHPRDHVTSPRASIIVEETETGLLPESLPSLTWAGEKLHAEWTARLLKGQTSRTRPWLKSRMPTN